MTDVLKDLLTAGWRQIEFPISARDFGFSHEQARHRYIFRDQQLIESLGRENPTYSYTIPFREDIVKGPYENLFTVVYPEFLEACLDRTRDVLEDPFHGAVKVKCASLREISSPNRRDGIDVEAAWILSPTQEELTDDLGTQIASLQGAENQAGLFDRDVEKIDWEQEQPPEPTISPFDAITSVGNQLEASKAKVEANLADVAFRAERASDTIDRVRRPDLAATRAQARRLEASVTKLIAHGAGQRAGRQVRRVTTQIDYGITTLANQLGLTVAELARLNPGIMRGPLVRAGTSIKTFEDGGRR